MATKANPGQFDCYEKALPNEPMFVLLARDPSAPFQVRQWALGRVTDIMNGKKSHDDIPIVFEALDCADMMETWREQNEGAWRTKLEPEAADKCSHTATVKDKSAEAIALERIAAEVETLVSFGITTNRHLNETLHKVYRLAKLDRVR